jgi:thiol-disulfide isomerase/thioredoxin
MRKWIAFAVLSLLATAVFGAAEQPHKLALGTVRPPLEFHLLDGARGPSWDDLHGKVVVIDFWATWCAPCVASIPHMNALKNELAGVPARFFSITYEPPAKVREFLAKHAIDTEVGIDDDLATFGSFVAWGIPMAIVLDRDGKVVAVLSPANLNAEIVRGVLAGKVPDAPQHPGWDDPAGAAKYFRAQLEEDRAKYGRN